MVSAQCKKGMGLRVCSTGRAILGGYILLLVLHEKKPVLADEISQT